jgi:hypothetical protein
VKRLEEEKVFKDPVHKYIYVQDPLIWDLINTREFQRLRRIRQLGTSYLTFHGAEHSRFSHSLGVYEITRRIISQFERHGYTDWPAEERLVCLSAALLHDLGHGPFSHSIEPVMRMNHEQWSCRLILGDTEVNRVLREVSDDFPERVAAVIAKTYEPEIAVSLISSQLDADRMDYLLRDAYFTGVNYGTFDLDRILRLMRPHRGRIVIKSSGMHAVEDYLMSRYQMYIQVYFHPVTRGSEIVLQKIVRRAVQLMRDGYAFRFLLPPLPQWLQGTLTEAEYLRLDESFLQTAIAEWCGEPDPVLSDLCRRFLHRRLFQYVPLRPDEEPDWDKLRRLCREAGLDPAYYLEADTLYAVPYEAYRPGERNRRLPIFLLDQGGGLTEISECSAVVRSLCTAPIELKHLYYPADRIALA